MGKNFVIGDLHGNYCGESNYLSKSHFPEQNELTKEDVLIQLGDFGYVWFYPKYIEGYKKDLHGLRELASKKFTTFVVLGNHENYDLIEELPIIEKWNGKVRELITTKGSIYFAIRGEIYIINGQKIFTYGGATSNTTNRFSREQYESGKLVRKKKYRYGELKRVVSEKVKLKEINIWEQENGSIEEQNYALDNLSKHNYKVDFILTHTIIPVIIKNLITEDEDNYEKFHCITSEFLEKISLLTDFQEWHFGHLHLNAELIYNGNKYICHYKTKPSELVIKE